MFNRIALLLAVIAVSALTTAAATFSVNTTTDLPDSVPGNGVCSSNTGFCTLRAAVMESNYLAGADTIVLPAGVYTLTYAGANEDYGYLGDLDIYGSALTIIGTGSGYAIILGASSTSAATDRVMQIWPSAGTVSLSNLLIANGRLVNAWDGGAGIRNGANLTLNNVFVRDNEVYQSVDTASQNGHGGGIYNSGGLTLSYSSVIYNKITRTTAGSHFDTGAGIANVNGTYLYLSYTNINNNSINSSTATITAGGGISFAAGPVNFTMTGGQISNNSLFSASYGFGGGVYVRGGAGGSISLGYAVIANNSIANGTATSQGGGLYLERYGAGSAFNASITQTTITNNHINGSGGGISLLPYDGPINLTLTNSTISVNEAYRNGGGMNIENPSNNGQATNYVTLSNCTVSGNRAYASGGGIYTNRATSSPASTIDLNYSTVAGNSVNNDGVGYDYGGGIYSLNQTTRLKSSAVADNFLNSTGTAPDVYGTVYSYDYNNIENLTGATITGVTTHNSAGDPALNPLYNNGGYTLTHLPATGSKLISKIPYGVNGCGTTYTNDQRGMGRPVEGLCDIGSVEWWQIN